MPILANGISQKDVLFILDNTWEISKGEWQINDKSEKEKQLRIIKNRLDINNGGVYAKIWKTPNKEPIAILGGYKVDDKKYETFFIASKHMNDYALKLSFEMRQIIKQQALIYKGCTLAIYSASIHPKQMSWFRFLGFKYKPKGNIKNYKYFEYSSSAN